MINHKFTATALLAAAAATTMVGFAGAAQAAPSASPNHGIGMYGNPAAAAAYWRPQHASDCGEMAVADVVGQITGHEPTERQITTVAENIPSTAGPGPIWHPPGGTDYRNVPVLLAHYGIQSTSVNTHISGLEQDLAHNRKVIVTLNAETIWNKPGNRSYPDHFVVVTGIDTRAGVVHLNDSGIGSGRDERISTVTFAHAWQTSNNEAVVTN
jgi:hypothetical protein